MLLLDRLDEPSGRLSLSRLRRRRYPCRKLIQNQIPGIKRSASSPSLVSSYVSGAVTLGVMDVILEFEPSPLPRLPIFVNQANVLEVTAYYDIYYVGKIMGWYHHLDVPLMIGRILLR